MTKNLSNKLVFASLLAFFLCNIVLAQNSLTIEAKPSSASKSKVDFANSEKMDLYEIDGKTLYEFAENHQNHPFSLHLKIDEIRDWEMELEASKVHGNDFKVLMSTGEEIEVEKNITYKGYLKKDPNTKVRLTIAGHLISGFIYDAEGQAFETIEKTAKRSERDLIVAYKNSEIGTKKTVCGHSTTTDSNVLEEIRQQLFPEINDFQNGIPPNSSDITKTDNNDANNTVQNNTYCPKLGITLDWQGLNVAGSVANFNADMQTILNIVNGYYDDFSVEYELNPIYVINSSPNPWTDSPGNQSQLVENFAGWAYPNLTPNNYNCALLFTGTNMNGIGYAYFGQMCTSSQYRYGEIDYQYVQPITQRANLTTHELGHLWDAQHGSTSSSYIMSPSIWDGTLQWTSNSISVISNSVNNTFNSCLPACGSSGPNITRGPYLQSGTPSSTVIKWRTSSSTDSKVWYGSSPSNLNLTQTVGGSQTDHEVTLSGLSANTTYYYAVGDDNGQSIGGDSDHYFTTAPTTGTSQPITAWVLGDCGTGNSNQEAVRDAYYNYIGSNHTDMILLLGDNAYNDGWDSEYQGAIFDMYDEKLKNTMMWSCPGNHDYYGQSGLNADYYDIFTFPTQGEAGGLSSNTEKYYSFDYGNLHIISLDSYDESRDTGSPMLTWLENDLAATTQEWIVVIFHHPPYSKGSHDSDTESKLIEMRENVLPICESYGVDLVLSGHSHSYERSKLINGHYGHSSTYNASTHDIDSGDGRLDGNGAYQQNALEEGTVYIVTGSAGKTSSMDGTHPVMYYSDNPLGSTIFEVNGSQMDVKFLKSNGVIEDYLTLTQNGTPSVNWTSPYNGEVFTNLNSISFAANATDNDGTVSQVEFFVNDISVGTDVTAPYTLNWVPTTYGNYTLKAEATDNEGKTNNNQISITVQDGSSVNLSVQVSSSSDDAEERVSDGDMDLTSTDLELAQESGITSQEVGMRFNNIAIPQGAMITNAYIQFTNDESETSAMDLNIYGEDVDNSPTFTTTGYNISNRNKTSALVNWSPSSWTTIGEAGVDQQTPNLSAIIQEIVNRSGWSVNNSLSIIVTGTEDRTVFSYDGNSSNAPILNITYSAGEGTDCSPNVDNDDDGYCSDVDCDDTNASIYPSAPCDDGNAATMNDQYNSNCICMGTTDQDIIVSFNITSSSDDAEERVSDGNMDLTSTDLELAQESGVTSQEVGMRFNNISIPQGATISNAYIQFTNDETESSAMNLSIRGEDTDHSLIFTTVDYNISSRTKTSASVNWSPSAWLTIGEAGFNQQSPDLSAIVQEIVNRSGWSANNSLSIIITGTEDRTAYSYDGDPSNAPVLHVTYSEANNNECAPYFDNDDDGYCSDVDCNDANANIYPFAPCDDNDPSTINDEYDSNCICTGTLSSNTTLVSSVVNSDTDDAEEDLSDGAVSLASSDLELVNEHADEAQEVGIRFNDIAVPNGAIIVNAYIQFTVDETDTETTNLTIYGEDHDNAPTFSWEASNISNRSKTSIAVSWNPVAWNIIGVAGSSQQTPNINAIVQEIVNRDGWVSGNSLALIFTGSGKRTAESYEGTAPPELFIEYALPITCMTIDTEDFESGWGMWNDGGSDARRNINDAAYANSGSYCVRLRDNTETSVMTTDVLDLSSYDEITVDFSYHIESFENSEDFWLQISTDGGATFTTVEDWVNIVDFQNGESHSPSVTIDGPFTNNCQIRFRCDASGNGDKVYIDDVSIEGCGIGASGGSAEPIVSSKNENVLESSESESNEMGEIHIFPNPASTELTVEYRTFDTAVSSIDLYDLTGARVLSQPISVSEGLNVIQLDVSQFSKGVYWLTVQEVNGRLTKRVMILR